ncbi:MAG: ElyC/SanA/YdcF family protein [Candidatus Pacearchaeota archaeon]
MLKRKLGFLGFAIGLLLLSFAFLSNYVGITGNFVSSLKEGGSFLYVFGVSLILISSIFMASRKTLEEKTEDAIVIPTGKPDEERAEEAYEYYKSHPGYDIIISGADKTRPTKKEESKDERLERIKNSHNYRIYKRLRENSFDESPEKGEISEKLVVKPKDITLEKKSRDTFENLYESIEMAKKKGIKDLYISTGDSQWERFKSCYDRLVDLGEVDPKEGPEIHHLEAKENFWDKFYGFMGNLFYDNYKLQGDSVEEIKNTKAPWFIKKPVNKMQDVLTYLKGKSNEI